MLEKEVRVFATDKDGFGSFKDTHILRIKNEDEREARAALEDAGIGVISYANAGMAYSEDVAEKLLSFMVNKSAEEKKVNGVPMSEADRVLADEAIYNTRMNVGTRIYDELLAKERSFAMSMVDDIMDHAHKNISVEGNVKLGLLTPGTLIEKLDDDSRNSGEIENLLEDELDKHHEFGCKPNRRHVVTTEEGYNDIDGYACKKTLLF